MPTAGKTDADLRALRDLVDAWAHHSDRREHAAQAALVSADGAVEVYRADPATADPVKRLEGHEAMAASFSATMSAYTVTTHFNGQSRFLLDDDSATGETSCLAYHFTGDGQERVLTLMAIRYLDSFVRDRDRGWRFRRRRLVIDWTEERPSTP